MQRRDLITWLKIGKQIVLNQLGEGKMPPPVYHDDAEKVARLAADPDFEATTVSRYHLHDFHFSHGEAAVVRRLLAFLRERGIEVAIFHPPVQAAYYDYLASDPRMQSEFGKLRGFVRDLAGEYQVVYGETLEDWGLDNSAVVDYGHFSRAGALRFTRQLHAQVHALGQTTPSLTNGRWGASEPSSADPPQPSGERSSIPSASSRAVW